MTARHRYETAVTMSRRNGHETVTLTAMGSRLEVLRWDRYGNGRTIALAHRPPHHRGARTANRFRNAITDALNGVTAGTDR